MSALTKNWSKFCDIFYEEVNEILFKYSEKS